MRAKLTNDDLKEIFKENTYNNVSQSTLAQRYNVSQGTINRNLKYFMLNALAFDNAHQHLSLEERANKFGINKDQYRDMVFRGKSKVMFAGSL